MAGLNPNVSLRANKSYLVLQFVLFPASEQGSQCRSQTKSAAKQVLNFKLLEKFSTGKPMFCCKNVPILGKPWMAHAPPDPSVWAPGTEIAWMACQPLKHTQMCIYIYTYLHIYIHIYTYCLCTFIGDVRCITGFSIFNTNYRLFVGFTTWTFLFCWVIQPE